MSTSVCTADGLLEEACSMAERGWLVFPLYTVSEGHCSCAKKSGCKHPGKHPRTKNGLKDASSDLRHIEEWWTKEPNANIGIQTGAQSGIFVLDVDGDEGEGSLEELVSSHGALPNTVQARSGRGRHVYFKHPGSRVQNRTGVRPGLDVRGDGGYIIAPPSFHASGAQYTWVSDGHPETSEPAEAPNWLLNLLQNAEPRTEVKSIDQEAQRAGRGPIPEGRRNDTMTSILGAARAKGVSDPKLLEVGKSLNSTLCDPPLEEAELAAVVTSVSGYDQPAPDFETVLGQGLLDQALDENRPLLPSGMGPGFDHSLGGGFVCPVLIGLGAGGSGMGKTAFLHQLLDHQLERNAEAVAQGESSGDGASVIPVVFFTELGSRDILWRTLARETGTPGTLLRNPAWAPHEGRNLSAAKQDVQNARVKASDLMPRFRFLTLLDPLETRGDPLDQVERQVIQVRRKYEALGYMVPSLMLVIDPIQRLVTYRGGDGDVGAIGDAVSRVCGLTRREGLITLFSSDTTKATVQGALRSHRDAGFEELQVAAEMAFRGSYELIHVPDFAFAMMDDGLLDLAGESSRYVTIINAKARWQSLDARPRFLFHGPTFRFRPQEGF